MFETLEELSKWLEEEYKALITSTEFSDSGDGRLNLSINLALFPKVDLIRTSKTTSDEDPFEDILLKYKHAMELLDAKSE